MKHTIRFINLFLTLLIVGAGNVWSLEKSDIIINPVLPNASAGEVKLADGDAWISGRTVKIIVTPASDFKTKKSLIIVEKMVDPTNRAPKHRTSGVGQFTLEGTPDWVTSATEYTFTVPEEYDGAYITATFVSTATSAIPITSLSDIPNTTEGLAGTYELAADIDASGFTSKGEFTGTLDGNFHKIYNLGEPIFKSTSGSAVVRNIIFEDISIDVNADHVGGGDAGAVTCHAQGSSRIYNCGILPTSTERNAEGVITGFSGCTVKGTGNVGSIVGKISGTARVINCYSYATVSGGSTMAGIVGNNSEATTSTNLKTMVMNCMFYGSVSGGRPVYSGTRIVNYGYTSDKLSSTAVNLYNYYRNDNGDSYGDFAALYGALPAEEEYLTRFEYFRSILNSNRQLCTYWITDKAGTTQTAADTALVAKWVLDPSIAPYPILKKWGKYPSVINSDRDKIWNPKTKNWVSRSTANAYEGKKLGTLKVKVNAGSHQEGNKPSSVTLYLPITDMDTLNCDYGYAKVQLPYYNEQFGNPSVVIPDDPTDANYATKWNQRYGGNYKDYVVTGWEVTSVTDSRKDSDGNYLEGAKERTSFEANWQSGYNFADRNCIDKDLYGTSGRIFAQGGYYYVPEDVTEITITAHWGKAVYLHNNEHSMDRVSLAYPSADGKDGTGEGTGANYGYAFTPAGTLASKFQGNDVYQTLNAAIAKLEKGNSYTVYDQAVVLVGNVQIKNRGGSLGRGTNDSNQGDNRPYTIMSVDLDLDNEPDYCLELQQRNTTNRPGIHPVRFDFLPVPELGLTMRANTFAYSIGLMVPQGHFEITETAFMHTTQFEYDAKVGKFVAPLILNGGHFEQIVLRYGPKNRTSYILMGGNFRIKRFTPGYHATPADDPVRHCAVNAIGGEYPEFYLSGIYAPDKPVLDEDNPHCYTNGGKFDFMAGAGYEQVKGDVTFKIDHSIIKEFYGGGINGSKPVTGDIDVTINNSLVGKYCGGPKVGPMTEVSTGVLKTVKTNATGTTFGVFYGGGNGGTSYYRQRKIDNTGTFPTAAANWEGFSAFNPLNQVPGTNAVYDNGNEKKGYHAEYEFEVFNSSNGLKSGEDVIRAYCRWAQFGTTTTGNVTNNLTDCTITGNFFGGGNLANVTGNVNTTLKGETHIYGSAFAGGYSASIPSFRVHDKSTVRIPAKDSAGNVAEQGSLDYYQDGGKDRYYTWCYKNKSGKVFPEGVVIPPGTTTTNNPAFQNEGKWYVLTTVSLEGLGAVSGNTSMTIDDDCTIDGSVYGGGDASKVDGNTEMNLLKGSVNSDIYGGGNVADVGGNTKVFLLGGTVNGDVYGGGKGRLEAGKAGEDGYVSPIAATVGSTKVNLNGLETGDYVAADHSALVEVYPEEATGENIQYYTLKSKDSNNKAIKGCVVKGNIFGCNNLNGTPKGSVTVNVYKTEGYDGHQRTGYNAETATAREAALDNIDDNQHSYEVQAVYGGGNLAAYEPNAPIDKHTQVNIYGCGDTSIKQVYGGGNAASTPATQVDVYGTYEIEEIFGGGNGKDDISKDGGTTFIKNPGANVGFKDYWDYENEKDMEAYDTKDKRQDASFIANYVYGSGEAHVNIHGGKTHRVYGGSNTKGNVKAVAVTMLEEASGCDFNVDEAYGGGKSAPMDGASKLEMACIPGLKNAYGGAEEADIQSDVTLTITNGNFDRVFGGNNVSGTIHGKITVNIEETGCHLITIGQLYGGGNQAAYTGPWKDDNDHSKGRQGPTVNAKSFTSIGDVYGGGYGKTATVEGDTEVNINVCDGKYFGGSQQTEEDRAAIATNWKYIDNNNNIKDVTENPGYKTITFSEYVRTDDGGFVDEDHDGNRDVVEPTPTITVFYPKHTTGKIGGVNNVYGGGNAAMVQGNTTVNIGTNVEVYMADNSVNTGDNLGNDHYTLDTDGEYKAATGNAIDGTTYYKKYTVKGASITGNVYGGGNNAEVTGNTNVNIGKKEGE